MGKVLISMDESRSYRVYLTVGTDLVEKARQVHNTTPLASAGLGRVLIGAGLMGIQLKSPEERLTLIFKGDGPAKQILATANGAGRVKGYIADPNIELPRTKEGKLDVGGSLGIGELTVIKDLGLKEPYVGNIALSTGEIADDLTVYYYVSEQQNASVGLGVKTSMDGRILAAGGMIIHMMPDYSEEAVTELEKMIDEMMPLTALIEECTLEGAGKTEEGLLNALQDKIFRPLPEEFRPKVLETKEIMWECDCSVERLTRVIAAIGKEELRAMIEEDGQAELVCQFCLKKYMFNKEELTKILESL